MSHRQAFNLHTSGEGGGGQPDEWSGSWSEEGEKSGHSVPKDGERLKDRQGERSKDHRGERSRGQLPHSGEATIEPTEKPGLLQAGSQGDQSTGKVDSPVKPAQEL